MSGSSRYTRVISAEVGEIERRLRHLERDLERIGRRASASAKDTAEGFGDAVAAALVGWSDRFRERAGALGGQSASLGTSLGKDAAKFGGLALNRLSEETEQHPLFALGVALGVGILIGVAGRSFD